VVFVKITSLYTERLRALTLLKPFTNYRRFFAACLLACMVCTPLSVASQQEDLETVIGQEPITSIEFRDNLGRDTPRTSFIGFLSAAEEFNFSQAVQYLDLRNLPRNVSRIDDEELAKQLDFIIKRGMKIDIDQLSAKPSGQVVDGLPEYRDELGRILGDDGEQTLYLQRVPGVDDNFIWKISNVSVALVPELYDYFSYPDWIEYVKVRLPDDSSFLGIELFKWVIILGVAFLLFPVFWLTGYAISRIISKPGAPMYPSIRRVLTWPVPIVMILVITGKLLNELGLGARAQSFVQSRTVVTIVVVWLIFSLIDLMREKRKNRFLAQGRADAHILGRPLANALKLITLLAATLTWLSNAGVEISALLAGLGIGGVALALALQKPIEDLLGAVSLYSQQPIQTGDLCKYGTTLGFVEEIGLRTTRIRTLNDTQVSVPNCIIAHGPIENYSARKKMLYHPDLPLRYDTTGDQMKNIMDGIDAMARGHEKVIADSVRVTFTEFSQNAMMIKVRIYVDESDFGAYLSVVGELNLSIMQIVQDAGAHFAQGAQTIMFEQGVATT